MPLKSSRPLRPEVVLPRQEAGGWARRASRPSEWWAWAYAACLCSWIPLQLAFPWGGGFGQSQWELGFHYKKEKEMNLSSCVADSVVLSFDSDGQTLGSGTSLSPLPSFQHSTLATFEMEPNEVGVGVIWGWALEYLRIAGKPWEAFLGTQGLGSSSEIPHPEDFTSCFKSMHWSVFRRCSSSFRVAQVYVLRVHFLSQRAG